MNDIKVIVIYSLAYSGSSWMTMVLGSGKEIVSLGGGDRLFSEGPSSPRTMCLVHGGGCDYWPSFFEQYSQGENFFVQLAEHTGATTFVINNPSIALFDREFVDDRLDVRVIKLIRDGRASLASAMRHHPHRVRSVYQSALAWLYRGTRNLERRVANTGKPDMLLRYEDAVMDPDEMLRRVGEHTGVAYTSESLRYWDFEHHLPGANQGALDILMRLQGLPGIRHDRSEYYDALLEHIRKNNGVPKLDESWREAYMPADMAAYDFVAGELYTRYGYERPAVSEQARQEFLRRHNPPPTPEEADKNIPPWRLSPEEEAAAVDGSAPVRGLKRLRRWVRRRTGF